MRRSLTIVAVCAAALLLAGWALGDNCTGPCSNTGVKFVPDLLWTDPYIYPINIPCCNNYTRLSGIWNDMFGSPGCDMTQGGVTAFDELGNSASWTGPLTFDRDLACGESVWVSSNGAGPTPTETNTCNGSVPGSGWVVVGADCSNSSPLVAAGYTFIQDDPCIYQFSLPPLTDALDLEDVYLQITSGDPTAGLAAVAHFHPDQSACSWLGPLTCNELNITGGDKFTSWDFTVGLRYSVNLDLDADPCEANGVKWIPSTF